MKLSDFIEECERVSSFTDDVNIHVLISDLKKINESQKVTVPKFISDWIFKAQLVDRRSIRSALETADYYTYADGIYFTSHFLKNRLTREIKYEEVKG